MKKILSASSPKTEGEIFNLGSGKEVSINDLANAVKNISNRDNGLEYIDRRDIDNVRRRVLNIEKIRKSLRWVPETTLMTGLTNTYNWLARIQSKKQ